MRTRDCVFAAVAVILSAAAHGGVRERFADPPPDCRLQCWYHWASERITEESVAADMKAMAEFGIGTAHVFMPNQLHIPPFIEPLTPEWWKIWEAAIREAKRNGIKLGFHNCPGWSSSGGKWIRPEDSMKILVASETDISDFSKPNALPVPRHQMDFYRDVAVMAFPVEPQPVPVKVSGSFKWDFEAFRQGRSDLEIPIAASDPKTCSVTFEYEKPFSPCCMVVEWNESSYRVDAKIMASSDGEKWTFAGEWPFRGYKAQFTPKPVPLSLDGPARFFKVVFTSVPPSPVVFPVRRRIASISFSTIPRMANLDAKNGAEGRIGYLPPADGARKGVDRASIVDLTEHLRADGTLAALPDGVLPEKGRQHRVLRIGYTTTGKKCEPAPRGVRGLECDKLSKRGLDAHWPHMPAKMIGAPGAEGTVAVSIIDSYEVSGQNWTEDFEKEFRRLRGYDIRPWLPAVIGYSLGTDGDSSRFLFDLQLSISDLMIENYYGYFAGLCRRAGVSFAAECYWGPFESLRAFRTADIPTGEFWIGGDVTKSARLASSAAHLNGRPRAAAEAFTSDVQKGRWQVTPHELRVCGDRGWLEGISQFVLHSYLQQPFMNVQPGFSLGRFGSQLNRNTTWWREGRWWSKYVHRGQFLLQSGVPRADAIVLAGDSDPNWPRYPQSLVDAGYNFDYCSAGDLERLTAMRGGVGVPGGEPYAVLCLGKDRYLRISTLRAIRALLDAGVRVAGTRPLGTPSFGDDVAEWEREADAIWGAKRPNLAAVADPLAALRTYGVRAPIESKGALRACRRAIEGRDFYFVVNCSSNAFDGTVSFAAEGSPELWDAKTGAITPLPWIDGEKGRVKTRLSLNGDESAFVSFREPLAGESPAPEKDGPAASAQEIVADLSSGWRIASFSGKNAPPAPLEMDVLESWEKSSDDRLKFFAGRAVYEKSVSGERAEALRRAAAGKDGIVLDLGDVREIANVWAGGAFLGCLWEPPYRVAVPESCLGKSGAVDFRIEVVNTWPNRLIGDARARAAGAPEPKGVSGVPKWVLDDKPDSGTGIYTWMNWLAGWTAKDELRPAGLLGPVRVFAAPGPRAGK